MSESEVDFQSYLDPDFVQFVKSLFQHGLKVALVGGTVRDFYLNKNNKHDYDCELRTIDPEDKLEALFDSISIPHDYHVEELPFRIKRVEYNQFSCELSMPRVETFDDSFSHKNFEAEFVSDHDYSVGFKRRDFTLNAMMYEYIGDNQWKLIDPLNGLQDLENETLRACSEEFYHDPVRFLRGIRFNTLYEFELDHEFKRRLSAHSISDFSSFYLREESIKSKRPLLFLFTLLSLTHDQCISVDDDVLNFLRKKEQFQGKLKDHLIGLGLLHEQTLPLFNSLQLKAPKLKYFDSIDFDIIKGIPKETVVFNHAQKQELSKLMTLLEVPSDYRSLIIDFKKLPITNEQAHEMVHTQVECHSIANSQRQYYLVWKKYLGQLFIKSAL